MGEENEAKATVAEVDDTKKAKKPKADRLEKKSYARRTSPICRTVSFHARVQQRVLDQSIDRTFPCLSA